MKRKDEERVAAGFEADAFTDSAWEDVPSLDAFPRRRLGAQVTIRLDPELAERLRAIATRERVGYTSLLRRWIEERVRAEESDVVAHFVFPTVTMSGAAHLWSKPIAVELSGHGRLIEKEPLL